MNVSTNPVQSLKQIAVIGTGLLGASVGLGLKKAGYNGRIVGVSRKPQTLSAAQQVGGIDEGIYDVTNAAAGADLLIVATPLSAFDGVMQKISEAGNDNLIITDVGSTKSSVVSFARQHLTPDQFARFVPAHPMAGSEQQGPEGATADLFHGKPCILTPDAQTNAHALELVSRLWSLLGMKLLHMTPQEHDEKCALVSHLPHIASVLLAACAKEKGGTEVASTGFRDTTRLSASNPTIRADIIDQNREAILAAMDIFESQLSQLRSAIASGDNDAVRQMLDDAKIFRDQWADDFKRAQSQER